MYIQLNDLYKYILGPISYLVNESDVYQLITPTLHFVSSVRAKLLYMRLRTLLGS